MLDFPDLDDELRTRFRGVIRDEVKTAMTDSTQPHRRLPVRSRRAGRLEDMLGGADLVAAASGRIERPAVTAHQDRKEVDETLW